MCITASVAAAAAAAAAAPAAAADTVLKVLQPMPHLLLLQQLLLPLWGGLSNLRSSVVSAATTHCAANEHMRSVCFIRCATIL